MHANPLVDRGLCVVLTLGLGVALFAAEACGDDERPPPLTDVGRTLPDPSRGASSSGGSSETPGSSGSSGGNQNVVNPEGGADSDAGGGISGSPGGNDAGGPRGGAANDPF
jgi:hypothetical protein